MAITTADMRCRRHFGSAGQRATLAAVRAALGGGSFSTIGGALKTWRAPVVQAPRRRPPRPDRRRSTHGSRPVGTSDEQAQRGIAATRRELAACTALEARDDKNDRAADALAAAAADTRQELETTPGVAEALRTEPAPPASAWQQRRSRHSKREPRGPGQGGRDGGPCRCCRKLSASPEMQGRRTTQSPRTRAWQ